jgi:tetratricopeptide (TPR) repeat protein
MPAHIFTRMGYWRESIITNQAGAAAAKASLAATYKPATGFVDALHAMDYMMYAYLQEAQDEAAKALLDEIAAYEQIDKENLGSAYALAAMPARYVLERGAWDEAAMIALHPAEFAWERFPQAEATQVLVQGLGAAHVGNVEAARQSLERLHELHDALVETDQGYWADQATIQIEEVAAWLALAEGKPEEALASMRHAAELESVTEKHPVTPGPIVPAYELLGDMLLDLGQSIDALAAFETSLQDDPNRFRSLYGAATAAELAGEMEKANGHYTALVALGESVDSDRAELVAARTFLGE